MPAPNYRGEKSFIRQIGGTIQFSQDGTATQTVIWKGPTYRLKTFRLSIPRNSPDFPELKLSNPPNERNEGAYTTVTAIYGGTSDEISAGYPNEPGEGEDEEDLTTTYSLTYRHTSKIIRVADNDTYGEWRLEYRAPFNTISYTTRSKQNRVSKSGVAQVSGESPRIKLLNAVPLNADAERQEADRLTPTGEAVSITGIALFGKGAGLTGNPGGIYADTYQIVKIATDFTRNYNGRSWRNSETWTNIISQGVGDD